MNEKLLFIVAHYRTYIGQEHVLCYKKKNFQWIVDFQVTRFLMIDCWMIERIFCCASNFRTGGSFPHVVDVDWRLDYYIKVNWFGFITH